MNGAEAEDWNRRYAASDELVWSGEPNRFLPPEVAGLPTGRAVDLACGEGRNAVWLARLGWDVTGVDFSTAGLTKAARLAERHGVTCRWVEADATTWAADERVDLVVIMYLHLPEPAMAATIERAVGALAPGGVLLAVGHDRRNLTEGVGGPQDPTILQDPEELAALVTDAADRLGVATVVERAETVERPATSAEGERTALDCIVRARRLAPG